MTNYFTYFNIPEQFHINEAELKTQFLQNSKKHHPDFYLDDEEKYAEAMELSSFNNSAYKTLKSLSGRVEYILKLNDLLADSKNAIPPAFLMEMMEFNEAIMDLKMEPNAAKEVELVTKLEGIESELDSDLLEATKAADETTEAGAKMKILERVKDLYLKQKYLLRLRESVNTFAA